jgi:hypothetical protein
MCDERGLGFWFNTPFLSGPFVYNNPEPATTTAQPTKTPELTHTSHKHT